MDSPRIRPLWTSLLLVLIPVNAVAKCLLHVAESCTPQNVYIYDRVSLFCFLG